MNTDNFPKPWHTYSVGTTLDYLEVEADRGLNSSDVNSRLAEYGPNELVEHGA